MLMVSWYRKLNQGGFNGRLPSDRLPSVSASWRCQGIEASDKLGNLRGCSPLPLDHGGLVEIRVAY
jgi:hypothetical protein